MAPDDQSQMTLRPTRAPLPRRPSRGISPVDFADSFPSGRLQHLSLVGLLEDHPQTDGP